MALSAHEYRHDAWRARYGRAYHDAEVFKDSYKGRKGKEVVPAERGNERNYSATHHECFARGPEPAQFKILHEMVDYAAVALATATSITTVIVGSAPFYEALRGMNHSSTRGVVRRCEGVVSKSLHLYLIDIACTCVE